MFREILKSCWNNKFITLRKNYACNLQRGIAERSIMSSIIVAFTSAMPWIKNIFSYYSENPVHVINPHPPIPLHYIRDLWSIGKTPPMEQDYMHKWLASNRDNARHSPYIVCVHIVFNSPSAFPCYIEHTLPPAKVGI